MYALKSPTEIAFVHAIRAYLVLMIFNSTFQTKFKPSSHMGNDKKQSREPKP